jgi:1-acyl-sn-glycerol-3-phosphate acyltransferase
MLNRVDRRSQLECLKACGALLAAGAPVLFFPEGTRSKTRCAWQRAEGGGVEVDSDDPVAWNREHGQ